MRRQYETDEVLAFAATRGSVCLRLPIYFTYDVFPAYRHALDRTRLGGHVDAWTQSLDATADGGTVLGRLYRSRPLLRSTDPQHRSAAVRRVLKSMACLPRTPRKHASR